MVGRQLPLFSLIVPFWLIWAYAGFRGMIEVWPAVLVAGVSFAVPQFLVSNFHGPWLVDIVASVVSMTALAGFLRVWRPAQAWAGAKPAVVADALASDPVRIPPAGSSRLTNAPTGRMMAYLRGSSSSVLVFAWSSAGQALLAGSRAEARDQGLDKR